MAKSNIGRNIALGATGLAITAGAVAAGIMLGDKTNRKNMAKKAKKGFSTLATVAGTLQGNRSYAVAHEVSRPRSKSRSKKRSGK